MGGKGVHGGEDLAEVGRVVPLRWGVPTQMKWISAVAAASYEVVKVSFPDWSAR